MSRRSIITSLLLMSSLVAVGWPLPGAAQGAGDTAELEARCRANAPTEEEVAICVNVVRRYLALPAGSSPAPSADTAGPTGDGASITVDGSHVVTLLDQEWDWPSDRQFVEPSPGNMFVTVLVRFEGLDEAGADYGPGGFKLFDQDGFEYGIEFIGREPSLGFGEVRPNQPVQGWVTFQVPETTTALSLAYSDTLFFDGEAGRWELGR
jgi:hypothetical protein